MKDKASLGPIERRNLLNDDCDLASEYHRSKDEPDEDPRDDDRVHDWRDDPMCP